MRIKQYKQETRDGLEFVRSFFRGKNFKQKTIPLLLSVLFLLVFFKITWAEDPYKKQWTRQLGTVVGDEAYAVAVDGSGNAYVSGWTDGALDGNTNAGRWDIFLIKYDTDGNKSWTRQIGTSMDDGSFGVAVDGSGNAYVSGWTDGAFDGNTSAGEWDLFLIKYGTDGNKSWTRQIGTSMDDVAYGVAVDGSGNAYVAGYTNGGLDGNTNAGGKDLFLVKYDTDGNKLWTKQMGTSMDDAAYGVEVDGSGNAYLSGYTNGGLDGNTNAGGKDLFLVKYDTDGNKLWTRQLGTSMDDIAWGVAVDGSGNAYVAGYTNGGLNGNTNAGSSDLFLMKYDTDGNKLWTRQMGTSTYDYAYWGAVDGSGNAYVTGGTGGGLDGNTNAGGKDLFLVKYDTNGNKLWTRQMGTVVGDSAFDVAVDGSGNAYVAGWTMGGLDGNTNAGGSDLFLIKYSPVCSPPIKPLLNSPSNGATSVSTIPTLDWDDVSGATSYKVQVCTDGSCLSIVRIATPNDSEWAVTPALSPGKLYYWRVKAVNACGSSSWSNVRSFTTACPTLDVPSLISPPNGTIGVPVSPTLDWNDVSGATSYNVQVCSDINCLSIVASAITTSSQWAVTSALSRTTTYYWHVKAKNTCGSSTWSEVWSFKTKPTITVVSPNGSPSQENWQAGTTQTIQWTYTGNAGLYVKIELFKSGVLNRTITPSTSIGSSGTGSYNWAIKPTQQSGCDYKIKITNTTNSNVADKSDGTFCISQ